MSDALTPGARIGSYEVIDRLGAGGMGEVYRARDTRLGRVVALKVLRADADPELLHRLDREARAASALNHPNIVHIYDVGETPAEAGGHYVVMEYVEGETLRRRLARGPLPLPEVLDLGAQIANGLAKAHRAGIVHRDLKPENLMVTHEGLVKILDFGLAKRVVAPLAADLDSRETLSRHETRAGTLLGTLEYMSPEQAAGRTVDHRTDQFSLGLILHEMVTGRPAFRRDSPAQVLAAVIERDPEPLRHVRPQTPDALDALVGRCVQKNPDRRFARTDEIAAELAAIAGRSRAGSLAGDALPPEQPVAVSAEIVSSGPSTLYHVQVNVHKVRVYEEAELAERIRKGKLTGIELARRDDQDQWQPLFDTRVYRREIPVTGDPLDAARRRALRGLLGHFSGFVTTGVIMFAILHEIPFWMAIWGAVLAAQTIGALPKVWPLLRPRRLPAAERRAALPAPEAERIAAVGPTSVVEQEAARVRALIEQRGGKDALRLVAEVDGILKLTAELAALQADLEEQTSDRERAAVASALAEARARLARADLPEDRRLFERQVEVLEGHEEAIAKAMRVLDRLRVRRDVAEHQLKQLRLDLSRGAATGLDVPELSSRLEFIRYEVDAREEVAQMAAERG